MTLVNEHLRSSKWEHGLLGLLRQRRLCRRDGTVLVAEIRADNVHIVREEPRAMLVGARAAATSTDSGKVV